MQAILFTDNLADLSPADVILAAQRAGFAGLDLTLRPGGHVLPPDALAGLAAVRRLADAANMTIPMVSTSVTAADEPHARAIFAAAAQNGVGFIKLGYWRYEPFGNYLDQLDEARRRLEGLARLGREYHVLPCVHCHSGRFVASGGMALYELVRDADPESVGAYVDPMHMTVEGGSAGWEIGLDVLAPWLALVGVKNFRWEATERDADGQQRFRPVYVPLADGQAPLPQFVGYLRQLGYDGVVSLHSEYKGGNSFRRLSTAELLEQSKEDLTYMKKLWNRAAATDV